MAGFTDEVKFDMHKFETDIRNMLQRNTRCNVEERIFRVQNLFINHIADNNLEGYLKNMKSGPQNIRNLSSTPKLLESHHPTLGKA